MNTPVSFEIAKLLKEKGIHIETFKGYYTHGDTQLLLWVGSEHWNNQEDFLGYAPTIAEVVMWLYEKHEIWIAVTIISHESWQCYMTKIGESLGLNYNINSNSPTEAYEAAIIYTLEYLI